MLRRDLILSTAALALSSHPVSAQPQPWPSRPLRLVVPFPAGGATDLLARSISQRLALQLGQPVVVDNRDRKSVV